MDNPNGAGDDGPGRGQAKLRRRLTRQIDSLTRRIPLAGGTLEFLLHRGGLIVRLGLGILFVVGGLLSVLPFLGIWMLPFGLAILALDLPFLRPAILRLIVSGRRRATLLWRRWRRASRKRGAR